MLYLPPEINGHRYSWASVEVEIAGVVVAALTAINYGSKMQPGKIYGSDGRRAGRTPGEADHTCEFTILRREWNVLLERLGPGFGRVAFDVRVQYAETERQRENDVIEGVTTDYLVSCRVSSVDHDNEEGTDATSVRVACDPMDIRYTNRGLSIEERLE